MEDAGALRHVLSIKTLDRECFIAKTALKNYQLKHNSRMRERYLKYVKN
jgi:hypothetical protein